MHAAGEADAVRGKEQQRRRHRQPLEHVQRRVRAEHAAGEEEHGEHGREPPELASGVAMKRAHRHHGRRYAMIPAVQRTERLARPR